jgi:hypothetical protein
LISVREKQPLENPTAKPVSLANALIWWATRDLLRERFACLIRSGHPAVRRSADGRMHLKDYLAFSHILVAVVGGRTGPIDTALATPGHTRHVAKTKNGSVNEDRADREQTGHKGKTNAEVEGGDPSHEGPPKLRHQII